MPKKMRACSGVLYEYLDNVMHDCASAICQEWADIYHVDCDEEFEDPSDLTCAQLLGLAHTVCEVLEDEETA